MCNDQKMDGGGEPGGERNTRRGPIGRALARRALFADRRSFVLHLADRALVRARWQWLPLRGRAVELRLRGRPRPYLARLGTSDFVMLSEVILEGEYALVAGWMRAHRTEAVGGLAGGPADGDGTFVLDLGANAGYSVRYWTECFPGCRILAVEPDPSNFETCRRNTEIGGAASSVDLVCAAAAAATRPERLDRSGDQCSYRLAEGAADGLPVDGVCVSDLLARPGVPERISLLKCDIEGAEAEIFRDCRAWIHRVDHLAVETHPPYTPESLLEDVRRCGARVELVQTASKPRGLALVSVRLCEAGRVTPHEK